MGQARDVVIVTLTIGVLFAFGNTSAISARQGADVDQPSAADATKSLSPGIHFSDVLLEERNKLKSDIDRLLEDEKSYSEDRNDIREEREDIRKERKDIREERKYIGEERKNLEQNKLFWREEKNELLNEKNLCLKEKKILEENEKVVEEKGEKLQLALSVCDNNNQSSQAVKTNLQQKVTELQAEVARLQATVRIQPDVETIRQNFFNLQSENNILRTANRDLTAERNETRSQLVALQSDTPDTTACNAIQTINDDLRNENRQIRANLYDLENANKRALTLSERKLQMKGRIRKEMEAKIQSRHSRRQD